MDMGDVEFAAFPMVCFCDIPLSRIDEHVKFYGEFGIGMTKEWAIKKGLSPVQYISPFSDIPVAYRELILKLSHAENQPFDFGWDHIRYLNSYSKPLDGNMVVDGQVVEKEFIQESEWRFIANDGDGTTKLLSYDSFIDSHSLETANNETRANHMLKFEVSDIKYIFVKSDSDIPDIVSFIQNNMTFTEIADQALLVSRVISLESIIADI
ncbi:hypothetical protein VIBRN418_17483 [Vibrio sp. N418]|nr:hypothetical protein VIBRN418_17483 [Vibrio sp. N418]